MTSTEQRRIVFAAVQRAALAIVLRQGVVCADDVRAVVTIPDGIDPRIVGPAFGGLKRDGFLERIGTHPTGRPIAHGRDIRDWRLKGNRPAAEQLVAAQPMPISVPRPQQRGMFDALEKDAGESAGTDSPAVDSTINPPFTGETNDGKAE